MKTIAQLITFSLLILLTSCASYNNPREIKEANFDGLKFESLNRYDQERLAKFRSQNQPLSLCHRGEFEKAMNLYKDNLDNQLNNYQYWNEISTCYILEKKYTQAKLFLDLALSRTKSPQEKAIVLNNLGVIYMENDNYPEAKEYFKQSIKLEQKYLTPKYNIAQIYIKYGLYNKAQEIIDKLLTLTPNDVDFLNSKAHIELMQQRHKSALVYFNRIPATYRSRDDIATNLAMTYYMLGLYENAEKAIGSADKKNIYYVNAQLEIKKKLEKIASK